MNIYENNQVFYQDRLKESADVSQELNHLELWFIRIIEPKPLHLIDMADWKEREQHKLLKGVSAHCDPELIKYVGKLHDDFRRYIEAIHKKIF